MEDMSRDVLSDEMVCRNVYNSEGVVQHLEMRCSVCIQEHVLCMEDIKA